MNIVHAPSELKEAKSKICLAIGFFDGVHLGHQQIIRQTISDARQREALALVLTFDRHPNSVVAPEREPPLIYSLPQKLRAIQGLGADSLLLIQFDKPFSEQTGEAFVRGLVRDFPHIQSLCVGANFLFGHKRGGNVDLLRRLGQEIGFSVHGMSAVSLDGKAVSSTRIRQAVLAGDLDSASQMLGRAYSLSGSIVRGDGLGKKLGFPTANIDTTGLVLPPRGVYAAHAGVSGRDHRAVVNIGLRPTLDNPSPQLRVEAHLMDFQAELYGEEMVLTFVEKLRDETKFASLAELRDQIARDVHQAQARF